MSERFIMSAEHIAGIVAVILFGWTLVLLWATWQIHRIAKQLDTEWQAVRRWQRLNALAKRQNVGWQ